MEQSDYPARTAALVVKALKEERLRKKMSMEALAAKAGVAPATISFLERELRNPTLDTLLRVSEVLQIELGQLVLDASRKVQKGKPIP